MKTKPANFHNTVIFTVSLIWLSGMFLGISAGQRSSALGARGKNPVMISENNPSPTPRPIVDDTPINPDTLGKIKSSNAPKHHTPQNQSQKSKIIRNQ
jgi:hypothetical protein